MSFVRENMNFAHYRWSSNDEGRNNFYFGEPSRRAFDRNNGMQVLFLINCYASVMEGFSLIEGRRLETKIAHQLPDNLKSEISVFNWMMQSMKAESL